MGLSAIVYRSRAVAPMTDVDLFYLLAQVRRRNAALGLTGLLLYDRSWFFQWIEGDDQSLGQVWNAIRADRRHSEVVVFADQPIPMQIFAGWHMRFAHRDRQHDAIVDGFSVADPNLLDDLHLNPEKTPNILAAFSSLGGADADTA